HQVSLHRHRAKETRVTRDQAADVYSTVGNLIRIALAVELEEAREACKAAKAEPLDALLLDPKISSLTRESTAANRRLLEAFTQFRGELEAIRREWGDDAGSGD